jgi:hypothetical protein
MKKRKTISEKTRLKMRLAKLGKSGGMLGLHFSEKTKEKMRKSRIRYYNRIGGMPQKTKDLLRKIAFDKGSGLWMKGRVLSHMRNEKHPMWKGKKASLTAIHVWIKRRKVKPNYCEHCKTFPPRDLANIGHTYNRNIDEYLWLCRKCHMIQDGRIKTNE